MKKRLLIFMATFISSLLFSQHNIQVEPKGEFANINVKKDIEAVQILEGFNFKNKNEMIKKILENPNEYNPVVLTVLSNVLFKRWRKEEGLFWFYTGQLRARYDANRCADKTAGQAVAVLRDKYGLIINRYAFRHIFLLKKVVDKVIDFVRNNEEKYDHRWINLHGMMAFSASLDENPNVTLSIPQEDWKSVKEKTINAYYEGFKEALLDL